MTADFFTEGNHRIKEEGVVCIPLIRKRRFWPKYIRGEEIKSQFESFKCGFADDASPGKLDNIPFAPYIELLHEGTRRRDVSNVYLWGGPYNQGTRRQK